jgi:invasion protein IalB
MKKLIVAVAVAALAGTFAIAPASAKKAAKSHAKATKTDWVAKCTADNGKLWMGLDGKVQAIGECWRRVGFTKS